MQQVRANILFSEVASIYELFRKRKKYIIIPKGPATDPTTKVKTLTTDPTTVVVDLTPSASSQTVTYISDPEPGRCWHCKRWTKEGRVGIPIKMRDDKFHHEIIVDIEGVACNYSCAYAFLNDRSYRDIYSGRISILRKIYELLYPGQDLKMAPDFSLLKENGGPLTDEAFDSGAKGYCRNPAIRNHYASVIFEAV